MENTQNQLPIKVDVKIGSSRAGNEGIKKLLAVYFEQNVTTEKFEDFDGERWVILNK